MWKQLDNYESYSPTTTCYLDGRYVNIVLNDVEEFLQEPMYVDLEYNTKGKLVSTKAWSNLIKLREGMNVIRVVIQATHTSHSALLWLDTITRVATYTDVRVEGAIDIYSSIPDIIKMYVEAVTAGMGRYKFAIENYTVALRTIRKLTGCNKQGYCNAYVIKEVLDWKTGHNFSLDTDMDVLRFVGAIESIYKRFLDKDTKPEVEYHGIWLSLGRRKASPNRGLGLLGGVALGSAISSSRRYGRR